mmetsp:Transcript_1309/g.2776  ORF Transcript_1309/g.2776 Transcript_1309/m.2776 type:complete len:521 (+) Transcript_1309:1-1563(+)
MEEEEKKRRMGVEDDAVGTSMMTKEKMGAKRPNMQIMASTIDWDGSDNDHGDNHDKQEEELGNNNHGSKHSTAAMMQPNNKTATTTTKPKLRQSMIVPRAREKPKLQEENQLRRSNFDWGCCDNEMSRRASLESSTEEERLSYATYNVAGRNNGGNDNDNEKNKLFEQNQSQQLQQQPKIRWSLFGNNSTSNGNNNNENGKNQKQVENGEPQPQQSPFQLFGGRRRQENQNNTAARSNEEKSVGKAGRGGNNNGSIDNNGDKQVIVVAQMSPFKRIFQRRSIVNAELENGSVNSETIKASSSQQESPSNSSNASSSQPNSSTAAPAPNSNKDSNSNTVNDNSNNDNSIKVDNAKYISSLLVKLRGCDSAASTLHQLHSYQNRNYYNLQYTKNTLHRTTAFYSAQSQSELQQLQLRLHFGKVERRRKARFLEDATSRKKKAVDSEERLKEELESIRTELFRMRMQMEQQEQLMEEQLLSRGGGGGNGGGGGDNGGGSTGNNDRREQSRRHDRVVIVGSGEN